MGVITKRHAFDGFCGRMSLHNGSLNGILLNPEFCRSLHVHHKISIKIRALPFLVVVTQLVTICNRVHHAHFWILTYFTSHSDLHIDKDVVVTVFLLQSDLTSKGLLPVLVVRIICEAAA
eukprot:scaffold20279_cov113-Amphora_coffeaeformis.AAC.1